MSVPQSGAETCSKDGFAAYCRLVSIISRRFFSPRWVFIIRSLKHGKKETSLHKSELNNIYYLFKQILSCPLVTLFFRKAACKNEDLIIFFLVMLDGRLRR